jgi:hypothetical protein
MRYTCEAQQGYKCACTIQRTFATSRRHHDVAANTLAIRIDPAVEERASGSQHVERTRVIVTSPCIKRM